MASVDFIKGTAGSLDPDAFTLSITDSTGYAAASATLALRPD